MKTLKTVSSIGIVTLSLGLGACQKQDTAATNTPEKQTAATVKTLSIGYQKSSLNLLVAREQKLFEQQFPQAKIEWKEFPAGPQMLEALAVGAVDFGSVGNTPPIFAQAADKELSYVGYEQVPANAQALLIAKNSSIDSIQALKGKRIAVQAHMSYWRKSYKKQGSVGRIFNRFGCPLRMHAPRLINNPSMHGPFGNPTSVQQSRMHMPKS